MEETVSRLIGLIWQANDKLAVDVAYRYAMTNGQVRAGLTFAVLLRPFESARMRTPGHLCAL